MRKRIVLDSNLIVSAFLNPRGTAAQALDLADDYFDIVASKETIAELRDVLGRDKFDKYASKSQRLSLLVLYIEAVEMLEHSVVVTDCRDPKDNKFLALAIAAAAPYIVTGDKRDLLSMNSYQGVVIIGLRAFVDGAAQLVGDN